MKKPTKSNQDDDKDWRPQTRSVEDQDDTIGAESSIIIPHLNIGLLTAVSDVCMDNKPRVVRERGGMGGTTNTAVACEAAVTSEVDDSAQSYSTIEVAQMRMRDELQLQVCNVSAKARPSDISDISVANVKKSFIETILVNSPISKTS